MCERTGGHFAQDQINFVNIGDHQKLGPWVGLCSIDRRNPDKVIGCNCVVVEDYGVESKAKKITE